ncbi:MULTISPECIES: inverse autotransporter beta domain-containing protein [Enterobacter]|uniref:inverse autotransporter beta domain-containing protein n=1 Tax=Enterobacter TaxID=547 RepID=UPI001BDECE9B|nr:inverse autotransporter beta domain-containing protein [Enterobacter asburiae]MBT1866613.1 inverse autotransporter beta domain-containing protein [Enterobacter asburiae]MBT1893697.1 inverse autotransporter beta domain-containing protein [Enterobacter asburiae]
MNILIQLLFPLAGAFTPAIVAAAGNPSVQTLAKRTRPYVLGHGETVSTVALRFKLSVSDLKKLNQLRTFSKPFEKLGSGDEIDVPVLSAVDGNSAAGNLTGIPAAGKAQTEEVSRWLSGSATSLAQATTGRHHAQVSDAAVSQARSAAVSGSEAAVSQWLSQFGTARIQLGVDDHFALKDSALDMLVPLYDNGSDVFFTQFGGRRQDDRTTLNLGTGVRLFRGHWMYGVNTFLDNDITGHNRRAGIGGEAWTDYLKLSANTYFGMTGWHQSRDFKDYDERPADGFDVAANAWLPAYPQLGGMLKYEQYQGDHVGLMGKDTLQKNPKAVTAGLNWTPVPLVTLGADYRNSAGHDEAQMQVQFSWNFGQSLADQLSADKVGQSRTLAGSRLDLVERNNNIVLDYRKQELVKLSLPAETRGQAGSQVPLSVQVTAKYGVDRIDWQAPEFFAAGGKIISTGPQSQLVQLPATRAAGNRYPVHAVARDTRGNLSRTASGEIVVEGTSIDVRRSHVTLSSGSVLADGKSTVLVTLTVFDTRGNPVSGLAPVILLPLSFTPLTTAMLTPQTLGGRVWDMLTGAVTSSVAATPVALANGGVTIGGIKETGVAGVYTATLTAGILPGTARLTPVVSGTTFTAKDVQLLAASSQAETGPIVAPGNSLADGRPVQITVPVIDASGKPLINMPVIVIVDGREISARTDKNGNIVTDLPGQNKPGHHDYVVGVKGDTIPETVDVNFVAATQAQLIASVDTTKSVFAISPVTIAANGTAKAHLSFTAKDGAGTAVVGLTGVTFPETGVTSTTVGAVTETNGVYEADLTGTAAGIAHFTVSISGNDKTPSGTHDVTLTAITAVQATSTITVDNTTYTRGSDIAVTVKLKDAQSNPVSGEVASLTGTTVTVPHATLKTGSSWADAGNGSYTATYTAGAAGTGLKASVTLSGWSTPAQSADYAITAATAAQATSTITVDNTTYTSGSDIVVTVNLKDAQSNPVSGEVASLSGTTVTVPHATLKTGSSWTDAGNGSYTATYTAGAAGTGLKASVKLTGWNAPAESAAYAITAGTLTQAQLAASVVAAHSSLVASPTYIPADDVTESIVTFTAKDAQNQPVTGMTEATVDFVPTTTLAQSKYSMNGFKEGSNGVYTIIVKGSMPRDITVNVAAIFGQKVVKITLANPNQVNIPMSSMVTSLASLPTGMIMKVVLTLKNEFNLPVANRTYGPGIEVQSGGTVMANCRPVEAKNESTPTSGIFVYYISSACKLGSYQLTWGGMDPLEQRVQFFVQ